MMPGTPSSRSRGFMFRNKTTISHSFKASGLDPPQILKAALHARKIAFK
jgi:hypothetical protein